MTAVGRRRNKGRVYPGFSWYIKCDFQCLHCGSSRGWREVEVVVARRQLLSYWNLKKRPYGIGSTTITRRECLNCGLAPWDRKPEAPVAPEVPARKHDPTKAERRKAEHHAHQSKDRR